MKKISLTSAEVMTQYQSTDTYKMKTLDNGSTVINFTVKTKVNDRAEKSPVIYDNCSKFCKTQEEISFFKGVLVAGNIIDVTGRAERSKGKDNKYYDNIVVDNVSIISGRKEESSGPQEEDNLPF